MFLGLLSYAISLGMMYVVIRFAVKHGIESSTVGKIMIKDDEQKSNLYLQQENQRRIEQELELQKERLKKLDAEI